MFFYINKGPRFIMCEIIKISCYIKSLGTDLTSSKNINVP